MIIFILQYLIVLITNLLIMKYNKSLNKEMQDDSSLFHFSSVFSLIPVLQYVVLVIAIGYIIKERIIK